MPAKVSRYFKDISLSFTKHPITNDIIILGNEDAIKKSVQNLVRTQVGERFFNRLLGSKSTSYLFELTESGIETVLSDEIQILLENFETRIKVRDVEVQVLDEYNELNIKIVYDIVGTQITNQDLEFILQPTRV